nr:hypothetical protein [Candidatus Cloacimonadota bacterium]
MKKATLLTILLIVLSSLLPIAAEQNRELKIQEFSVYDLPDDDGSGVILKWVPLDKEHRIIKYNIYRGSSPDSLFLLSFLEVDPKLGVLAPYLYYYDTGDQPILEFETSPHSLKKEKQQGPDSPLYQKFPLDSQLLGKFLDDYSSYALVRSRNLHHHSQKLELNDQQYSSLKLIQLESIYAIPKAGHHYYYAISAVNERGQIISTSEVAEVVPIDNPPDATTILHSSYYPDLGQMNFEWSPPTGAQDVAIWEGWLYPKAGLAQDGALPPDWQERGIQLFEIQNIHSVATYYHSEDVSVLGADPEDFVVLLAYRDYEDQMAVVQAKTFRILDASSLPKLTDYQVLDKPNDKGDVNLISFGKPLAYITLAEYTDRRHRRLKFNYEISDNELYTVDRVRFTFKTEDDVIIGEVTEQYVDKIIYLNLPEEYRTMNMFKAEMAVHLLGEKEFETEIVKQDIIYNDYFRRFQPQDTFIGDLDAARLYLDVLRMSKVDWDFASGLRANTLTRTYEHTIPYEDYLLRPIVGYDDATDRFLFDVRLLLGNDPKQGISFNAPLYQDAFLEEMAQRSQRITELQAAIADDPLDEELKAELEYLQAEYDFIVGHPAYQEAKEAKSPKEWTKIMLQYRDDAQRTYQYRLLGTDGHSAFVISDIYQTPDGNTWFMPKPQWFDTTKTLTLIATILLVILVVYAINITRRKEVYIRPIAGLEEIDNAIGRATEMGRPVMFVPGWGSLGDVSTIASLMILAQVAKKTAEYDIRLINPHCDYMVLPLAQEIVSTSYSEVGRPDSFNQNDIFFISYDQFPFCAGVNGITVRERVATIFYMGFFNAEALLLTETGNASGAIQIAATDAVTQIPFFITTCDYTLIGEEFYAASAYLSRNHDMVSMLKAQDYFKIIIVIVVIIGTVLSTLQISGFIHAFPLE